MQEELIGGMLILSVISKLGWSKLENTEMIGF
jgi:hypothetical protein